MVDNQSSPIQPRIILTLMWINTLMPTIRLLVIGLEAAYGLQMDVFDVVLHILVTPLNYSIAWSYFRGRITLESMGAIYVEIDSFVFVHLSFFADRHLMLVWLMGGLYTTLFIEAPLISNPKVKLLVLIRPLVLTFVVGFATGDVSILSFKDTFALFSIPSFALFGVSGFLREEALKAYIINELNETKRQLTTILEAVPFGIFVVSSNRVVVAANAWCLTTLECSEVSQVNTQLSSACYNAGKRRYGDASDDCTMVQEDIYNFLENSQENHAQFGLTGDATSALSWYGRRTEWTGQPAVIIVIKEVTELIQLERAQVESHYKNVMLRSVSHELRSPVNGILHAIGAVRTAENVPSWANERLRIGEICCKHLLMLIGDLLDYSQIIAGRFSLSRELVDVRRTLYDTFELMRLIAERKQLHLVIHIDPLIPDMVSTDANRLSQIVLNLLSNAVKFTPRKGKIALKATLNDQFILEVSVRDSGIGIAPDDINSLFQLFGRLESSASINPQGVGLGLHISNLLAIELGHEPIKVDSNLNEGSCFMFKVKIQDTADLQAEFISSNSEEGPLNESGVVPINCVYEFEVNSDFNPQVLVVDDSPFNRTIIIEMLATVNITCFEIDTGTQALEFISREAANGKVVQVIVMDVEMPGLDGPTTAKAIIETLSRLHLPVPKIIGHSANTDEITIKCCKDAGMVDFIPKPSTLELTLSKVRRYL
jgi:signal transduction histidine kinase